jgi:hypothetical protein
MTSPSPRFCGERVGVRGFQKVAPHPETSLRSVSDLCPQAGRGELSAQRSFNRCNLSEIGNLGLFEIAPRERTTTTIPSLPATYQKVTGQVSAIMKARPSSLRRFLRKRRNMVESI